MTASREEEIVAEKLINEGTSQAQSILIPLKNTRSGKRTGFIFDMNFVVNV